MKEDVSLDWKLLPQDPVRFFRLPDEFDRKQLRRSYSELIRQFKPETHPQQFQQIREAYELLDSRLRYGRTEDAAAQQATGVWSSAPLSAADAAAPRGDPQAAPSPAPLPAWEQLADQSPAAVYQQLSKKERRAPPDYYTLAILSDLVDRKDPLMFFRWLLTGLSEHPEEPGLMRLVHEYFRTDLPDEAIAKALWATSKVLPGDRYYYLTERLWDRLLKTAPFDTFAKTLEKCESNLRDHRIDGKLAFYIHILRPAAWKADSEWLKQRVQWLEQHGSEVNGVLEQDLEVTLMVCQYRSTATDFVGGDRVRGLIDQAIRSFCLDDPQEAARKIVECQDGIGRDALGVMEAFPLGNHPAWDNPLMVYRIAVAETADLVGLEPTMSTPAQLEKQSLLLLKDLRNELMTIGERCLWSRRLTHGGIGGALILAPLLLLYGLISIWTLIALAVLWIPSALVVYTLVVRPYWTDRLVEKQYTRRFRAAYVSSWRPRLYRYCQSVAAPLGLSLQTVFNSARSVNDEWWIGWLFEFVSEDSGLEIFAGAQPFLR